MTHVASSEGVESIALTCVQISGTCPGAGKTSAVAQVQRALVQQGLDVAPLDKQFFFLEPQYRWLGETFTARTYPSERDLLEAVVLARSERTGADVWLQDWSWVDLAEDLAWAKDDRSLEAYSRRVYRKTAAPCLIVYLLVDPEVAIARKTLREGSAFFRDGPDAAIEAYRRREPRLLNAMRAAPWNVVVVDASRAMDVVVQDVIEECRAFLRVAGLLGTRDGGATREGKAR